MLLRSALPDFEMKNGSRQGQNVAWAVLYVAYSLDSGLALALKPPTCGGCAYTAAEAAELGGNN